MTYKTDCTVEKFSWVFVLFRVVTMTSIFGMGGYILFSIKKWLIIPFEAFSILLFFYVFHTACCHCYYNGKRCDLGLGKLASLLFKGGRYNKTLYMANAAKSIPWLFVLFMIPLAAGILILITQYTVAMLFKVMFYLFLICLFLLSGFLLACPRCKMNKICPASIYRKKQ